MQHLIFLVFNSILMFTAIWTGLVFQKRHRLNFSDYVGFVIVFSLILGLRYKRGDDYEHYQVIYNKGMEYEQFLFTKFNDVLHFFYVSDTGIFLIYALIFAICSYPFLKYYRSLGKWLLPFFLMSFILMEEVLVRQALAYAFFFIYLRFLFDEQFTIKIKLFSCLAMIYIATSIHTAMAFPILVITGFYFAYNKPINNKLSIPIYLFFALIFQYNVNFGILSVLFPLLSGVEHFDVYVQEGSDWMSESGVNFDFSRNVILKPIEVISSILYLYLGYKILKSKETMMDTYKYRSIVILFNASFVGMCIYQGFFLLEIPRRLGEMIYVFWCVPMALIVNELLRSKPKSGHRLLVLGMIFFAYPYLKYLFFNDSHVPYLFLWDK